NADYEFTIEAWVEEFETWRRDTLRKQAAGQPIASDLAAGAALHARLEASGATRRRPAGVATPPAGGADPNHLLSEEVAAWAHTRPPLSPPTRAAKVWPVIADRPRARCGGWYEMFARSQGADPTRSATWAECEARLPEIAHMGFEVIYLPPIHPIGRTHRKGPNNSLTVQPGDPGSPYAIGGPEGGHDAIEPGLGTIEGFDHFAAAVQAQDMELALDFAVHCAPDHPWVQTHPDWFYHRPDGAIQYAENPPKRYEDIYPLNFYCDDWRGLWEALEAVIEFWYAHGVKIFRVDNPHTKPFAFWEWLLQRIRRRHADAIFLAEAFTRPKVMGYLAKLGFSQSYTYFTWRNTKRELTEYLTELTRPPLRDSFRPNFFVNTPDILAEILQRGGRPAFLQRLVLAATLSPSYGIYNGFELVENRAIPGTEEYADSEKYQFKAWDWDRPGHIKGEIARVNRIRRAHPALQRLDNLRFLPAHNDQILFYSKQEGADLLFIAVNLDPFRAQAADVELPLEPFGIGEDEEFAIEDLLSGYQGHWRGRRQWVRVDPAPYPAQIFSVHRG
ncbi:MAG: maltotransferase domain-containing protein, partial [Terriglobales bacterium]